MRAVPRHLRSVALDVGTVPSGVRAVVALGMCRVPRAKTSVSFIFVVVRCSIASTPGVLTGRINEQRDEQDDGRQKHYYRLALHFRREIG